MNSATSTQESQTARQLAGRVSKSFPRLAVIAAGITGNRSDSEDIVQQAIAIAIEKNMNFSSDSHFVGWLTGVVRNCAINHQRKLARRKTQPTDPHTISTSAALLPSQPTSPVNTKTGELPPMQNSFDDHVKLALEKIAPNARSCLLLRTVEGL